MSGNEASVFVHTVSSKPHSSVQVHFSHAGTVYLFTEEAIQIMSVTCLLSCSSSLFMSSIVMSLLVQPLKLFQLEHSDGISSAHELILQVSEEHDCVAGTTHTSGEVLGTFKGLYSKVCTQ